MSNYLFNKINKNPRTRHEQHCVLTNGYCIKRNKNPSKTGSCCNLRKNPRRTPPNVIKTRIAGQVAHISHSICKMGPKRGRGQKGQQSCG